MPDTHPSSDVLGTSRNLLLKAQLAIQERDATIERLSAALERVRAENADLLEARRISSEFNRGLTARLDAMIGELEARRALSDTKAG